MSFTGAVPAYSFASAPADAGALYSAAGRDARGDVFAQAATGDAFGRSNNIYDSYYGPAPAGLQNVDVMGHIARTNFTLPAYYQASARKIAKSQNQIAYTSPSTGKKPLPRAHHLVGSRRPRGM